MQIVFLGKAVFAGSHVIEHGAPAVVKSRMGLTQGNGNLFKTKSIRQLLCNALVALSIQLAAVDIGSLDVYKRQTLISAI